MKIYKTVAIKEFFWKDKTYRQDDEFEGDDNACRHLISAGCIGAKLEIVDEPESEPETAAVEPPENAAKRTSRGRRKKS